MIQHCVFLNLKQNVNLADVGKVMSALSDLMAQIDGFEDLEFGQNLDFENKSKDYGYGFIATFADQKALQQYADNHQHIALGSQLVEMCVNGSEGIIVFDLSV